MKKFINISIILLFTFSGVRAQVEKGFCDVRDVNFNLDTSVLLDGSWRFQYGKLLSPEQVAVNQQYDFAPIPGFWQNFEDKNLSGYGCATYFARIYLPKDKPMLALRLSNVCNAFRIWINGEEYLHYGVVGETEETTTPCTWRPKIIRIKEASDSIDVVLQVANFHHRNGGMQESVVLASAKHLLSEHQKNNFADLFLGGSLLVIAFFFMGMYLFWKEDSASLFFGLFALTFSGRVLITGNRALVGFIESMSWWVEMKIEFISMFLMSLFLMIFLDKIFPNRASKKVMIFINWYNLILIIFTICTPLKVYSYVPPFNNLIILCLFFYTFYIFIKAYKDNVLGAQWAILSLSIFIINIALMMFQWMEIIEINLLIPLTGNILFVLTMSFIFASRFGLAFYQVKDLQVKTEQDNKMIGVQNEQIKEQSVEIEQQKDQIEHQHELISDSIDYAQRIQRSLLPKKEDVKSWLPESFIFFRPQNVVSGDFYFCRYIEETDEVILAIADCTGHGVPGALMSIVGISSLDKIFIDEPHASPSRMLRLLNYEIQRKIKIKSEGDVRDGMDIALCRINRKTNRLVFSGGHHKLFYIKAGGETEEIKGCNHFIGDEFAEGFEFEETVLDLQKGDEVFMFSDGTFDQKGGPRGKRLYVQRMYEMLQEVYPLLVDQQHDEMEKKFIDWMGDEEQIDDMLLFGWKVK